MVNNKLNDELMNTLFTEIKRGVPYKYACSIAGISYNQFYTWRQKGKEEPEDSDSIYRKFYDEFLRAKALAVAFRVEGIRKQGEAGNWQCHAWWLERVAHEEFGRKSVIDANVNADVKQTNIAELFSQAKVDEILKEEKED